MNSDNRNLIAAIAISMLILVVYQIYFMPEPAQQDAFPGQTVESLPAATGEQIVISRNEPISAVISAPRVPIETPLLGGTVSRAGGRLDDLRLLNYGLNAAGDENRVPLLRATGDPDSYFAEILFLDPAGNRLVDKNTTWTADTSSLSPASPVTLSHEGEDGMSYRLIYTVDDGYMITIRAEVTNGSGSSVDLRQFARIRRNLPSLSDFFISYEGPIGVFAEDEKTEVHYDDIGDIGIAGQTYQSQGVNGWIGVTDKYWLTALIPAEQDGVTFGFRRPGGEGAPAQVDLSTATTRLEPGATLSREFHLFAGPKKINVLLGYNDKLSIERLDHAIDWGWFPFLTKPFFHALNWLFGMLGNFGLAILALTVVVKLAFFPLANRSYKSMAKMRELSPKIQELRERFSDDRQRQQQEMMKLYRDEKINPAAGCLPVLLQIPVFFALYKVLFVTIEMRHAPFYGWVADLSAKDPTSIINLFGLLPFSTGGLPDFINLGVWPLLMGITMFVQMSLNPPPPDPVQAKIFKFMPLMFTFLLATFPAGLVIYWTWNNLLSIIQQWAIMRSVKAEKAR
ncbi:membrane protein insertase YidC [Alphaproteobacteria bacterium LSUCC0684]